jgi:hypothetical protein
MPGPLFIPADAFIIAEGTPALAVVGTSANGFEDCPAHALDAASTESVTTLVTMPSDWNAGSVSYYVYWSPSSTNTGNVLFELRGAGLAAGQQIDQAFEFNQQFLAAAPGITDHLMLESFGTNTPDSPLLRLCLRRLGADGTDTFTADAYFIGVRLDYTTL